MLLLVGGQLALLAKKYYGDISILNKAREAEKCILMSIDVCSPAKVASPGAAAATAASASRRNDEVGLETSMIIIFYLLSKTAHRHSAKVAQLE